MCLSLPQRAFAEEGAVSVPEEMTFAESAEEAVQAETEEEMLPEEAREEAKPAETEEEDLPAETEEEAPPVGTEEAVPAEAAEEPAVPVETEEEPALPVETEAEPAVPVETEEEPAVSVETEAEPAIPAETEEAVNVPAADPQGTVTSGSCGDDVTWTLYDDGRLVLSGSGETYGYPNEYPGFHSYRDQCTSLEVEEGITQLGTWLFYDMSSLTSVTLGKDVATINMSCFSGCSALTEIRFKGHAPETIASSAFTGVSAKAYYYPVPDWTGDKRQNYGGTLNWVLDDEIGDNVKWDMYGNGYIIEIYGTGPTWDFPSEYPGFYAFQDEITQVIVNPGVTRLGDYLFYGMSSMESLRIYPDVQEIGEFVFSHCYVLKKIYFAGHAPSFSDICFSGVTATAYYCPWKNGGWTSDVMKNYGGTITWECLDHMGDDVTWTIDDEGNVFLSGTGPTWVCGADVNTGYSLIRHLVTRIVVKEGITTLGAWQFELSSELETVYLPNTLTAIDYAVFRDCSKLTSVKIPYNVSLINGSAFRGCSALAEIRFKGHAPTIESDAFSGVSATATCYPVYSWDSSTMKNYGGTLTWVKDDKVGDSVTWKLDADGTLILSGTGAIWSFSLGYTGFFEFWEEITSAIVEEGVTELGEYLFFLMGNLKKVTLPLSLIKIRPYAFSCCSSLPSITIPAGVTEIGLIAFDDCSALSEIRFLGSAPSIAENSFKDITATACYPADDTSWTEDVMQQYGGTITWVPYISLVIGADAISATLPVHDMLDLYAIRSGEAATGLTWSSSDDKVATVDQNGLVTAKKYGKCTITASTDGGFEIAECELQTLFWDVAGSPNSGDPDYQYYYKPVYWAAEKSITKGYDLEYFGVGMECERQDFILFIYRLAGQPSVSSSVLNNLDKTFSDVSGLGNSFRKAIAWGYSKGIIKGYTSGENKGKFGVGFKITRKDAMIMLWRYAGKPTPSNKGITTARSFTDVNGVYGESTDTFKAIAWAAGSGIANGYTNAESLPPDSGLEVPCYGATLSCLREQMITFLYRYNNKYGN